MANGQLVESGIFLVCLLAGLVVAVLANAELVSDTPLSLMVRTELGKKAIMMIIGKCYKLLKSVEHLKLLCCFGVNGVVMGVEV